MVCLRLQKNEKSCPRCPLALLGSGGPRNIVRVGMVEDTSEVGVSIVANPRRYTENSTNVHSDNWSRSSSTSTRTGVCDGKCQTLVMKG